MPSDHLLTLNTDRLLRGETYHLEAFAGRGNSGDVYKVTSKDLPFALKVFFPYYALSTRQPSSDVDIDRLLQRIKDMQTREHSTLSRIEHPNIMNVRSIGTITLNDQELDNIKTCYSVAASPDLPYILSNYVEGWNIREAIDKSHLSRAEDIAYVFQKIADALQYLHLRKHYVHADIRPENILIREFDREPILIDFALCKNLDFSQVSATGVTTLEGDWDLFPNLLDTHPLRQIKERGGTRESLKECALPALDFFQFGRLLETLYPLVADKFAVRERRYLQAITAFLTSWGSVSAMRPSELSPKVARLGADHFSPFGVPELGDTGTTIRSITVPPGIAIPITKTVQDVIESRSWRRLTTINQLSLLSIVYPGADYRRSTHVLYAYELCRKLILSLFGDPLFRWLFGPTEVIQALVVTLLHDINHFPFLHIFRKWRKERVAYPDTRSSIFWAVFATAALRTSGAMESRPYSNYRPA